MQKLVLISILVITVAVPMVASGALDPALALRRVFWWMLTGVGAYALAVMFVYPLLLS